MKNITVIYSLSTAPFFAKNPRGEFKTDKFELYTAAISALVRRRAGNVTVMHCDTAGAEYFKAIGLTELWDDIRITIPDDLEGINPRMFWAAGKLFALRATPCPVLQLDTDFIAWHLPELKRLTAAHREELSPNIYPDIHLFKMKKGYRHFPDREDKTGLQSVRPLNTAFLYMPDEGFKQYYIDNSIEFMKSAEDCGDYLTYMVYAEQRLLAILAHNKGVKVDTVLNFPDVHNQSSYTHTWGAKQVMRDIPSECERFCEKCRKRIRRDFPEWVYIIERIEA